MVKEDTGALPRLQAVLTMKVIAVTRALEWLKTQRFAQVCFLSEHAQKNQQWLGSYAVAGVFEELHEDKNLFQFVPGHAGIRGNERADRIASVALEGSNGPGRYSECS